MTEETESDILKEIEGLMRERLTEAYALGHQEGRAQGHADGILAERRGAAMIEAAARTLGASEEREALAAFIATNGRRYHPASEAGRFIKRLEKFMADRTRVNVQ